MKILCIEDDEGLAKLLERTLAKQRYQVKFATDGETGWKLIETEPYDLILLDWMLPNLTGIELCQRLRSDYHSSSNPNRDTPILLMTALNAVTNRIMGLNAGADDYIVKPFDLGELLARIRALLRRSQGVRSPVLEWGDLCLKPNSCEVTYQGHPVQLAAKEYELLELFLRNPDQIFSLDRLLVNLWSIEEMPTDGAVRAHIKGLRQKLKRAGAADPIETIYKLGYRLRPWSNVDQIAQERDRVNTASLPLDASESQVSDLLWDLWQECRQSYCDRLSVVQEAVQALHQGTLTSEQRHSAEREAHTLIGSLGSFGLTQASQLSRQIQQIFKQSEPLQASDANRLSYLVATLKRCLEPPSDRKKTSPGSQTVPLKRPPTSYLTPLLLIVDDDLGLAQALAREAVSWGLKSEIATSVDEAQQRLQNMPIDAILLDLNFMNSDHTGLDFLASVHQHYPNIPVVVLTAEENFENRVIAARLGSRCFLQKPIALSQVLASVTQLIPQPNQLATRILIVDDDPALLNLLKTLLEPYGYQIAVLSDPHYFWRSLEQVTPDLLIFDVELSSPAPSDGTLDSKDSAPPLSGIELCQVIRSDPRWNRLPVIFLSAHADLETVQRGFAAGADDFLSKPVSAPELLTRVRTRLNQRKLWGASDLDELTGVCLRRTALQDLTRLIRLAHRQHDPFTLALLDIDYFKQVNDNYGHGVGDQVLSYLGKLLRQSFREEDIVGRWGGEEFIIGMYGTSALDGKQRLEHVLQQLRHHVFLSLNGVSFNITFSAGIAQLDDSVDALDELKELYQQADQALYQAKTLGRNQILLAEPLSKRTELSDSNSSSEEEPV